MNLRISTLFLLIGFSFSLLANDSQSVTERQRLENLISELSYLQIYVQETEVAQVKNMRSRFDYQQLVTDIELVKQGVSEYLGEVSSKPKNRIDTRESISGNYVR